MMFLNSVTMLALFDMEVEKLRNCWLHCTRLISKSDISNL